MRSGRVGGEVSDATYEQTLLWSSHCRCIVMVDDPSNASASFAVVS